MGVKTYYKVNGKRLLNMNVRYRKNDISTFINIMDSIVRNVDHGECVLNGKVLSLKIEVRELVEDEEENME